MALLPEMMHPVRDSIRFARDDAPASMQGEGFVWFAERSLMGKNGDSPNPNEALRFLLQAAELGVASAFVRLGRMCETGIGAERNLKLALAAYLRAAAGDNADGYRALVRVLSGLAHPQGRECGEPGMLSLMHDPSIARSSLGEIASHSAKRVRQT
jgi:TPR repeat protein